MASKSQLGEYVYRLFHKSLVQITGGLGFVCTLILEFISPGGIIKWLIYLALVIVSMLIGSYQVFTEIRKEHSKELNDLTQDINTLNEKIRELEEKRPRVNVRFVNENGKPTQRLKIHLTPLPPMVDLENKIKEKRNELIAKKNPSPIELDTKLKITIAGLDKLNPDYDREVDEYLINYRQYLIEKYECSIADDRLRRIEITVENKGLYPATDVTIEMSMPREFKAPSETILLSKKFSEIDQSYFPSPPKEPSLYFKPTDLGFAALTIPSYPSQNHLIQNDRSQNTSGPTISFSDETNVISYKAKKLIQNLPEQEFDSVQTWLGGVELSTTWEIPVKIYAAELPSPVTDTLWIDLIVD